VLLALVVPDLSAETWERPGEAADLRWDDVLAVTPEASQDTVRGAIAGLARRDRREFRRRTEHTTRVNAADHEACRALSVREHGIPLTSGRTH
jgi:hypothetical protein